MSSTLNPKVAAIFKAKTVEGTNFPLSIAFIVCLLTPAASASCCCVIRTSARATLILFFIICSFFCTPYIISENCHKDKQNSEHIIQHYM